MDKQKKSRLEEIRKVRLEKVEKLRELGVDPYPTKSRKDYPNSEISEDYKTYEGKTVTLAGRLMSWREHGNIAFGHIQDESGQIQLFIQKKLLKATSKENQTLGFKDAMKLLDVGDFIQATGEVGKTVRGEISLLPTQIKILTKSIRPLPSTFHGLKDVEERYRKRYLDLLLNEEVKQRLNIRSKVITTIREFLDARGYIEVETPTLQPVYGGGFAKPFVTHHNALDSDFYLRISDEMYLKRLVVGGYEKVYEITKVFRNEGVDHDHNPEFTIFEAMTAYQDYNFGMDIIEEIIEDAALKVLGNTEFDYQGIKLSVKRPWKRLKVVEAIEEFTGVDPLKWSKLSEAKKTAHDLDIGDKKLNELDKMNTIGEVIAFVFEEVVEEKLIQPTIIYDYPVEISPLAKKCKDERFTQRFEMFAFGSELGNNYTELTDPVDLHQRFVEEKEREKAGFDEAHQTDYQYLKAIEQGFPPTCGIAIGIDRLVMMFTDAPNIRETIAFPTLKPIEKKLAGSRKKTDDRKGVKSAKCSISAELKKLFPGISYAYTIINDVSIKKADEDLESFKKEVLQKRKGLELDDIQKIGPVASYREMLKKTGVKLGSRRPSPEALLRRIVQGKGLYKVNTAVDAYNMAVVETGVGLGGFNLDKVVMPITLRLSKKGEGMLLLGDDKPTLTKEGEIVYSDNEKLLTLDLNYRDIDETKITKDTKDIILFADGGLGIDQEDVVNALELGAKYIQKYCGGEIGEIIVVT